jgi:polyketide synthase 12/myxalamid-type polyketide synthase MxaB
MRDSFQKTDIIVKSNGYFIITGGLGGLGLITAELLLEINAKKIILLSRTGKTNNDVNEKRLLKLKTKMKSKEEGFDLQVLKCDIAVENEVIQMLKYVHSFCNETACVVGIIHAAGVLNKNFFLANESPKNENEVKNLYSNAADTWIGKTQGAWYLHKHTKFERDLKFFITFSSFATAIGFTGLAAYCAANRFLFYLFIYSFETFQDLFSFMFDFYIKKIK